MALQEDSTVLSAAAREQVEVLLTATADVVSAAELGRKVERSLQTGAPLRVKLGMDPTAPYITLGHTVVLRKLRQFQDFGHQAVLIIGDFTARIGDPSGRSEVRPQLTAAEVAQNAATWKEQAFKVLIPEKTEIQYNSHWLAPLNFADVVGLASQMTVARMLERDDFAKRYAEERPIFLHEFFYPLMQGRDSVAIRADVELGGTDQKFNLLVGRMLQERAGQQAQVCLMTPLLVGLDGKEKMSKSKGNHIGVDDPPEEMYGKVMSMPDDLMSDYFRLVTLVPPAEVAAIEAGLAAGQMHPRDVKMRLAREIVQLYHGAAAAAPAEERFRTVFQQREIPDDLPEKRLAAAELDEQGRIALVRLLIVAGLVGSTSEARRTISQGGVSIDGEKVLDPLAAVAVRSGMVLRAGKRRFARIVL